MTSRNPPGDDPVPPRRAKGGFAIVRSAEPPASAPPFGAPRTATEPGASMRPPLSDPGRPAVYDGLLTPVAEAPALTITPVQPAAPSSTPPGRFASSPGPTGPVPARVTSAPGPAPSASMTLEMSAALAGLKRANTGPGQPAARVPTAPPTPAHASGPPSPAPAAATTSAPMLPAWAAPEGSEANPWAVLEPPPPQPPRDWAALGRRIAPFAGVGALVLLIVGGGWSVMQGASSAPSESAGALDDAFQCRKTLVRGRDLICVAPPDMLTDLAPTERDARLNRGRALATFAGMQRLIFEDEAGRTWRTLVLTEPAPSTAAAGGATAPSQPAAPKPAPPPPTGAVDTVAP